MTPIGLNIIKAPRRFVLRFFFMFVISAIKMVSYGSIGLLFLLPTVLHHVSRAKGTTRTERKDAATKASDNSASNKQNPSSIRFLAIGDWGGQPTPPYYTPSQLATAQGMGQVAESMNSQFVVALGDNFYYQGVTLDNHSSATINPVTRFNGTFDGVYTATSLTNIPWYVIAGNHDHRGSVQAQMDYQNQSKRWKFPSLYHAHSFIGGPDTTKTSDKTDESNVVTLDLILLDTVLMVDDDLTGTSNFTDYPHVRSKDYNPEQWQWLEQQLNQSTADYLLVGGHYPVYSICSNGPTPTLIAHLKPLLEKYNAQAYLSGHDHCMVHFSESYTHTDTTSISSSSTTTSSVDYIVTGMGDGCCYNSSNKNNKRNPSDHSLKWFVSAENRHLYNNPQGGFTSLVANTQSLVVKYHDHDGHELYQADPIQPRKKKQTEKTM